MDEFVYLQDVQDDEQAHEFVRRTWCYKTEQQCRRAHSVVGGIDVVGDAARMGQSQDCV